MELITRMYFSYLGWFGDPPVSLLRTDDSRLPWGPAFRGFAGRVVEPGTIWFRLEMSLQEEEDEEEPMQAEAEILSSSSEEEAPKPTKREEENLPVFLQEEKRRLMEEAMAIGYKKHQITRALRDGIPSASVEVLLDNIRYSGYGKLPSYKDAAVASLPDDAPLPWNPFRTQAENEKKIKQHRAQGIQLEDYGAQLLALASPAKNEVSRHEILSTSGVFTCKRSRIAPPRPPAPSSPPSPSGKSGSPMLRRTNSNGSALTQTRNLKTGAAGRAGYSWAGDQNLEEGEQEEPGSPTGSISLNDSMLLNDSTSPKSGGETEEKRVEEAARRLRSLQAKSSKGDYPPIIQEEDERRQLHPAGLAPEGGAPTLFLGKLRCNKCGQDSPHLGDSWCLGCSALEALVGELRAGWGNPGTRSLATDILTSSVRQVRALRRLGIAQAGKARARTPDPAGATRAESAPPAPEAPPETKAPENVPDQAPSKSPKPDRAEEVKKEDDKDEASPSEYTDGEETEEDEDNERGLKAVPKSAAERPEKSPIQRRRAPEISREPSADAGRARSSRREERPREPRHSDRRPRSRGDQRRSRSHHHRRREEHPEASRKGKRKRNKHKQHRAGSKHQRLERALQDPFRTMCRGKKIETPSLLDLGANEGEEVFPTDVHWATLSAPVGSVLEIALDNSSLGLGVGVEAWLAVLVREHRITDKPGIWIAGDVLGSENLSAMTEAERVLKDGFVHLCADDPCGFSEEDNVVHVQRLRCWLAKNFNADYLTAAGKKLLRRAVEALEPPPGATKGKGAGTKPVRRKPASSKPRARPKENAKPGDKKKKKGDGLVIELDGSDDAPEPTPPVSGPDREQLREVLRRTRERILGGAPRGPRLTEDVALAGGAVPRDTRRVQEETRLVAGTSLNPGRSTPLRIAQLADTREEEAKSLIKRLEKASDASSRLLAQAVQTSRRQSKRDKEKKDKSKDSGIRALVDLLRGKKKKKKKKNKERKERGDPYQRMEIKPDPGGSGGGSSSSGSSSSSTAGGRKRRVAQATKIQR
eukprot:s2345_g2.t1